MNKEPLKVAVIGCGYVSQTGHIPAALSTKNVRLVALCDLNEEVVKNVAKKFKINRYYVDPKQMFANEKLDAVDICTPIDTHMPVAIQAMEAGCHVFTEKPLAHNLEDADKMIAAAKKYKVKLSVMQNQLFLPTVMKMKSIVDRGIIGDVVRVESKQGCPPQDYFMVADPNHWWHKLPGGVFGDGLPHPIYLLRHFISDLEPMAVFPRKLGNLKHLKYDEVQIILEGKRGVGTISASCNSTSLNAIDIYGTKGNIHCDICNSYVIRYEGKTRSGMGIAPLYARQNLDRSCQIIGNTFSTGIKLLQGKHRGLPNAVHAFYESIQNGIEPPVTAEEGREVLRILEIITSQMG